MSSVCPVVCSSASAVVSFLADVASTQETEPVPHLTRRAEDQEVELVVELEVNDLAVLEVKPVEWACHPCLSSWPASSPSLTPASQMCSGRASFLHPPPSACHADRRCSTLSPSRALCKS